MARRQGRHFRSVDFRSLSFPKTGAQITNKAKIIHNELSAKIEERQERIRAAAEKAGLKTGADVLFNLEEIDYGLSNAVGAGEGLTAGIAGEIKKELSAMQQEKEEVENLNLIINNLPPDGQYKLSFSELEYFGF